MAEALAEGATADAERFTSLAAGVRCDIPAEFAPTLRAGEDQLRLIVEELRLRVRRGGLCRRGEYDAQTED